MTACVVTTRRHHTFALEALGELIVVQEVEVGDAVLEVKP